MVIYCLADPSGRAPYGAVLNLLDCYSRRSDPRWGHRWLSLLFVVCRVGSGICGKAINRSETSCRLFVSNCAWCRYSTNETAHARIGLFRQKPKKKMNVQEVRGMGDLRFSYRCYWSAWDSGALNSVNQSKMGHTLDCLSLMKYSSILRSIRNRLSVNTTLDRTFWCFADRASGYNLSSWPTQRTNSCFIIKLLYSSTCFEHHVLIINRTSLNLCTGRPPACVMITDAV